MMSAKRQLEEGECSPDAKRPPSLLSDDREAVCGASLPISHPFGEQFCAPELSRGQYHVLDEAEGGTSAESSGSDSDFDSDLDHDELSDMLEADLPDNYKGTRPLKSGRRRLQDQHSSEHTAADLQQYDKVVLLEKGRKPVEPLPEGWVLATHCSGMPVYLHRTSRVACVSRPYFLGPGSVRKHDIPLHSVPCLQYMRALAKDKPDQKRNNNTTAEISGNSTADISGNTTTEISGNITTADISGNSTAEVSGNTTVEVSGNTATEVSGNTTTEVSGNTTTAEVSGNTTTADISGNTAAEVSGNITAEASGNTAAEVSGNTTTEVSGNTAAEVSGNSTSEISGNTTTEVPGNTAAEVSGNTAAEVPGNTAAEVSGNTGHDAVSSAGTASDAAGCDRVACADSGADAGTGEAHRAQAIEKHSTACPAPSEGVALLDCAESDVDVEGKDPSVTGLQLREYCRRRFHFRTLKLIKFDSWKDRRQHGRMVKAQRPQLSDKTKLLCFPMKSAEGASGGREREWVLNPNGKTWVCIFHEYLQRVLKEQPVYSYSELENSVTPYSATAAVSGIQYGTGVGSSKKQAKSEAARASLQILIPAQMSRIVAQGVVDGDGGGARGETKSATELPVPATAASAPLPPDPARSAIDLSFFDSIRLQDARVADLCKKAAEPSPFTILILCLQRNFGMSGCEVTCRLVTSKHQRNQFEMVVGRHRAVADCKNKKDGKQLAAQCLLQQLHPQLTCWGSLLRMYGNCSSSCLKAKRQQERDITCLQRRGSLHAPNMAILNKLRSEMLKLKESRAHTRPIGTIQLMDSAETTQSAVSLDMVEL